MVYRIQDKPDAPRYERFFPGSGPSFMLKDPDLSGQQDLLSIDDKGTLDLFISIEREITNWNVQLNDTYGKRIDWLLGILNIGMLILYYFVGITSIKESPTGFIALNRSLAGILSTGEIRYCCR
jgi:hypothetical protein